VADPTHDHAGAGAGTASASCRIPNTILSEHATRWNATYGTSLSQWSLGRAIRRLGLSRKKTLIASERDGWERARFAVEQQDIDAADIVVIDEFGSNLALTRRYAREGSERWGPSPATSRPIPQPLAR
jgi:hypothetical protein